MNFFTHENVSDRIIRIRDLSYTAVYLVLGETRACLIDTGVGAGSLKEYVSTLTDLPYDVILTHGHVDHAGGAGEFSVCKVYLHPEDRDLMDVHTRYEERQDYLIHTHGAPVPQEDLIPPLKADETLPLEDGMEFDLGGLTLKAIHVPGHTHGMCMILIKEERTILFGDACGVSVMILDDYATSVQEYRDALLKVKAIEDTYDRVIRNHGTCESEKDVLDHVIECCESVLAGTDDHQKAVGLPVSYPDSYFAKTIVKTPVGHPARADGLEGNLAYRPCKIYPVS